MNIALINQADSNYPSLLKEYLADNAPKTITAIGNPDILKTYDMMRQLRDSDMTVISGFHSPMERECLNILLRGKQSVIICPARSIEGMRIKSEYKKPLEEGRLLFLSRFSEKQNRISVERADKRNQFAAAISDEIFIPYAAAKSKTETLCRELIKRGQKVMTFQSEYNKKLIELGAETA